MPKVYDSVGRIYALREELLTKRGDAVKRAWFRIENKAVDGPTPVYIYDEIGQWGVTADDFVTQLEAITGPVDVHMNTCGGEVFEGIAIYNALRHRDDVAITIDGLAASIGSVIAMAASPNKLFIEPTARMMIHDGYAAATGNAAELAAMVDQLNSASDTIAEIYAARTGTASTVWRDKMKKETWYTGAQAVDAGLADGLVGATSAQNRTGVLINKAAAPKCESCQATTTPTAKFCAECGTRIVAQFSDPVTAVPLGTEGWVMDPDGSTRFDPDGDGDNDATPDGDTDNDYWSASGEQLQPIPPCPPVPGDDDTSMTDFLVDAFLASARGNQPLLNAADDLETVSGSLADLFIQFATKS